MENNIKVSIIIPAFNSAEWIIRCLDSIPKRDDVEIIVINDGSTDKTKELLLQYKEYSYDKLRIYSYKDNKGVSYARNMGIDNANGEYLLFVDSDDYIYGHIFDKIVANCLNGINDLIFYDMENNGNFRFIATQDNYKCKYGMFKFVRKAFLGDMRFIEGMQYAEDKDLHLKMIDKYPKCCFTGQVMYHYNYPRSGSLSAKGENR